LELVTQLGCDFAQGFYFSRPLEPDAVLALLRRGLQLDSWQDHPSAGKTRAPFCAKR
jgi:predicted signal transduction protein with EAL and GGDEF domain